MNSIPSQAPPGNGYTVVYQAPGEPETLISGFASLADARHRVALIYTRHFRGLTPDDASAEQVTGRAETFALGISPDEDIAHPIERRGPRLSILTERDFIPPADEAAKTYALGMRVGSITSRRKYGDDLRRLLAYTEVRALRDAAKAMTTFVEEAQAAYGNPIDWQTGALATRDQLAQRAKDKAKEAGIE